MALLIHLGHHGTGRLHPPGGTARRAALFGLDSAGIGDGQDVDGLVFAVQRLGATIVGLILLAFGLLGLTRGVPFLSSEGERVLGLSANGLLATVSVVVAAVLVGAAFRGPRVASTVMVGLGALFLLSALVNLTVLGSSDNLFAFQTSNVFFSIAVGLVLLVLGAYGRFTGNLPWDSPYAHPRAEVFEPPDLPRTPGEVAAEAAMRAAEIAVVQHYATEDQRRRVQAMAGVRTRGERRLVWMQFDQPDQPPRAA